MVSRLNSSGILQHIPPDIAVQQYHSADRFKHSLLKFKMTVVWSQRKFWWEVSSTLLWQKARQLVHLVFTTWPDFWVPFQVSLWALVTLASFLLLICKVFRF